MPQEPDVTTRIEELAERLRLVESRLAAIEAAAAPAASSGDRRAPEGGMPDAAAALGPELLIPTGLVPLLGRALLVLGGGYLLRAAADSGAVPAGAAAVLGLAYAGFWLVRCGADAARPAGRTGATFHAVAALAIAYPLVLENTLRFRAVGAGVAAALLLAIHSAGLSLGLRHHLPVVSWSSALGGVTAALVLLVGSRDLLPATLGLLGMAAVVERLGGPERAEALRWPAALGATLAVALSCTIAGRPGGPPEAYAALPAAPLAATALLLPALYVVSAAVRTLAHGQAPGAFDLVQTTLALVVGLGGGARVLAAAGMPAWPFGGASVVLAAACYLAAFAVIDRRAGQSRAFYSYTTLAGGLALAGLPSIAQGGALVAALACLGLGGVALGSHSGRQTLQVHGALYLLAAAAAAGLLRVATSGLVAPAAATWPRADGPAWLACAAAGAGFAVLVAWRPARSGFWPRLLLAAALGFALAGLVAGEMARALGGAGGPSPDAGLVGAVRMAVLCALAIGLAWAARRYALPEAAWIVPAILVLAGLKLLAEDFRHGRPLTLFLALVFYGAALLAVPRLRAGDRPVSSD